MENCLFCSIVEGKIPSKKVYEDDTFLVFHDIQPAAPVHVLIIPKKHIATMNDVGTEDYAMIGELHRVAQQVAKELGVAETGYRLINNCGPDSGQAVYHIHYHLLGGAKLGLLAQTSDSHAN
ncbi:histidine triad nucleotide-binding protein [Paenibacillus motobuensis]|uniref:histidine triad nucleotide-binding protein n=1 Tax=Paenibacillus TaxID=44249 RepID=UPI00203B3972|nr:MULTISPECIES: histidine triad nucleotide-binding protein [Paenibacillus]MCM3040519.1 histidine triad nucleotide-binding protein [Paenibacillus lutimineralis]MCM3647623.1 histidine triad nucleotide-binding protein [Paenibacillus motobuensis]